MSLKPVLIFRLTGGNRLSIPLILAIMEKNRTDRHFRIEIASSFPSLTALCRKAEKPLVVYSFMTSMLPETWREVRRLRTLFRDDILLLAGGPHPDGDPESTLKMGFDIVFSGPAEHTLGRFCSDFTGSPVEPGTTIYRSGAAVCLDDYLPFSRYNVPVPPLEIMRGCYFRCRFCQTGSAGSKPVFRSLASVRDYMEALMRRRLTFRTGFICPSAFEYGAARPGQPDPAQVEKLLVLARSYPVRHLEFGIFPSEIHPHTVTPKLLNLIKVHCANRRVTMGAQTGSDRLLRSMHRGQIIDDVDRAAALVRESGMTPVLDFILGIPGETDEDRFKTLEWIKILHLRYRARIQMHFFMPLAGTPYAGAVPAVPDTRTMDTLSAYHHAGICTDWWIKDMKTSREIVEIRESVRRM